MKSDNSTIKAIARATLRVCPELAPARVAVRIADGFEFSPYGSIPWPSRIETRGIVYYDPRNNTYYGKRYANESAARFAWQYRQLRNAVTFLRQLRAMSKKAVASQAAYWLKTAKG